MFIIISFITTFKVIKNHQEKLLLVSEKRITEAAIKCLNEKKCSDNKITLKDLYNFNYLEKEINPITKEYYSELSYIEINNNQKKFIVVN